MINKYEKELKQLFNELRSSNNNVVFESLYNKYSKLVYKIAFTILKNKDDSEDIVQSVFSKIYTLPKDTLPTRNILSWLYSVTKNESIALFRKNKNTIDIDSIYEIEDTDNEINNVIDNVEFNRLISKLNDKEKEIVSLKLLTDLSFEEIAKLLNKPTGTIKWRYYKSIHTLKLLLSNLGMFIITFVIGLKTMIVTKNRIKNNQSNSIENETNKDNENSQTITEESAKKDLTNSFNKQDIFQDNNITNKENLTNEEIQVPINESTNNINYYGVGILFVSGIFLLLTIIFLINFIKNQLKRQVKASKQ